MIALMLIGGSFACSKGENVNTTGGPDIFVRIKQVDLDGDFKYSKTVGATID